MGISGLLPLLKSIHKPSHLRNFAGQTLGVDAYGWLHRGTCACAVELAQDKPTRKHIDFALSRVRMLIHFGVKPYLVFDGDYLPSKAHTEKDRAHRRKESKRLGLELLRTGRMSMAQIELRRAVDVTPLMARELIEELKKLNVPYIVAPYEADSQLAYLEKKGIIDGVVSEDSDLLVFGVNRLLTKLDQFGECILIRRDDFTACRDISLVGWSDKEFRMMAMLNGCDYLAGIERLGLRTAYQLVRKHKDVAKIVRALQFEGKMKVPPEYLEAFTRAERTFLYQWVFCPEDQRIVNLNKVPHDIDISSLTFVGKADEPEVAVGVAIGDLDPNTKEKLILPTRHGHVGSRIVQTPDAKQGKPITEFFRSKRTPLAELDPNSFTPSPNQQRLLENNQNVTWSARESHMTRRVPSDAVSLPTAPSSVPQPSRRVDRDVWAHSQNTKDSSKRQRLCADALAMPLPKHPTSPETKTSRFFSRPSLDTPSKRRAGSVKGSDEFELWSDDTFAHAEAIELASQLRVDLPNVKKRKKLNVFADGTNGVLGSEKVDADESAQVGLPSVERSTLQTGDSVIWSQILPTEPEENEEEKGDEPPDTKQSATPKSDVFSQATDANFAAFKARFAFTAETEARRRQYEGTNIVHKSRESTPNHHPDPLDHVDPDSDARDSSQVANPPHSPRPTLVGSEDLIIPQSSPLRDEDELEHEEHHVGRVTSVLNLAQFTYMTC